MNKEALLAGLMFGGSGSGGGGSAEPFVVNLTPTTLDFTAGTMDKTVGEIYEAWLAGRLIRFAISAEGMGTAWWDATAAASYPSYTYPAFNATFATGARGGGDELMFFGTLMTNNPTDNKWRAHFYVLTNSNS